MCLFFPSRAQEKARATKNKKPEKQTEVKNRTEIKVDTKVKASPKVKTTKADPALDLFANSTDEDEPAAGGDVAMDSDDGADSGFPDLPDFFAEKHFFFFGDFVAAERRLLTRYIAAYDGFVVDQKELLKK